jgi:ribosomal protein S13
MAAVTSTLVALGGVGLSAAQAIKANKDMKQAASASDLAKQQLKQIKETNPFKAVQTPMLGFELAQQQQSQREAQLVGALEGAGAEGIIGGIGQVAQAGNEQDLQLAAQANQAQFGRDMAQAEAQQGIEARKAERDFTAGIGEIQEQNMRRAEATANRNAAIEGALSSLGTAALGIDKMIDLYRTPKNKSAEVQKAFNSFQDAQSKIPAGALTKQQSQDLGYNILMGDWN